VPLSMVMMLVGDLHTKLADQELAADGVSGPVCGLQGPEFPGTTLNPMRATGDQRAERGL
jgi:hypothetical protein